MFSRLIISELQKWAAKKNRKPLIIRGARQVGKTTLVHQFSKLFTQYIYLNLELEEDREPFENFTDISSLVKNIFFLKNLSITLKESTLIFIDEIQEVPEALNILRYFFEKEKDIAVVGAGSMLETLFNKNISFPVGRVEFKVLRPVSFPEFLAAMGESNALEQVHQVPAADFIHGRLIQLFHTYAIIGGMPEAVNSYVQNRDLNALSSIYDSLITSYLDDVEKYATSDSQVMHIRHAIDSSFSMAGKRIRFEGFGNSLYRSRDMGEALRTLEKAFLIRLLYPCTDVKLPILPDYKKAPRLQILDTGLLSYSIGIQKEVIGTTDLNNVYQGILIEHLVGQELLAMNYNSLSSLNFWVREKNTSSAEVDYLFSFEGKLIPIEVKSGTEGKLKSLHLFMDLAPHKLAVRFYAGQIAINKATTPSGNTFYLLNLPYYLVSKIEAYLDWFQREVTRLQTT